MRGVHIAQVPQGFALGFLVVAVVVVVIYVPMLWPAQGTAEVVEAINYVADTLLFAGTALILAEALGAEELGTEQTAGIRLLPFD